MKVVDLMRADVKTIDGDKTIEEALKEMLEERVSSLIVENGNDIGIITRKDIIHKVIAKGKSLETVKVRDIMSPHPLAVVDPDMDIQSTAILMARADIRRFPVAKEGEEIIGIISNSDILKDAAGMLSLK